jgi:hypothetical protein
MCRTLLRSGWRASFGVPRGAPFPDFIEPMQPTLVSKPLRRSRPQRSGLKTYAAVLDGEVIVPGPNGTSDFGSLQEDLGAKLLRLRRALS